MGEYAIYNPHGKPLSELPVIYGFNNGGSPGFYSGVLLAEDGTGLGGHVCSNEGFMLGDLGIREGRRSDRHETFRQHYPDGYRMDFVSYPDVPNHAALSLAFKLNQEKAQETEARASDSGSDRNGHDPAKTGAWGEASQSGDGETGASPTPSSLPAQTLLEDEG